VFFYFLCVGIDLQRQKTCIGSVSTAYFLLKRGLLKHYRLKHATGGTSGTFFHRQITFIFCFLLTNYSWPLMSNRCFNIFQGTDVNGKRTAVLRGLPVILGDENNDFFKTCFVSSLFSSLFKFYATGCPIYFILSQVVLHKYILAFVMILAKSGPSAGQGKLCI